jgi:HEPN domain-containing protein
MSALAERWLRFARDDLRVAEIVYGERIYHQACFHAQQCVEKSLKGVLVAGGHRPPRTHSITDLLSMLPSGLLSDLADELGELDDYYIPTRYPDALPGVLPDGLPGRAEAEAAVALAETVLDRIETELNL